jgi:HD-GYP domain-containing protein (c-di-GMP phosphodiesterase class II)
MEMVRVKDPETYFHCVRVSRGARLLARAAGLDELSQRTVEFAALFHDIGKVGVPDGILQKPAKLTDEEFKAMMAHPELSAQILAPLTNVEFYCRLIPGVRHHHERFDGRGYPDGVQGEEIPLEARIILVADTFDAMTADRPYRKGLSAERAYQEIREFAGRQFDPRLAQIFLESHPKLRNADYGVFEEMNHTVLKIAV